MKTHLRHTHDPTRPACSQQTSVFAPLRIAGALGDVTCVRCLWLERKRSSGPLEVRALAASCEKGEA